MRVPLGALGVPNTNPGTYSDVDCPFSCFLLGNGLDNAILGNECWPCHNICPAGTVFDTTNYVCSSSPVTTNDTGGGSSSCPGYCSWLPFSNILSQCSPCSTGGLSSTGAMITLAAVAVIAILVLRK
jgi:hypothetical protein